MIDHRSYAHNLSSCEIKAWKNSGLLSFELILPNDIKCVKDNLHLVQKYARI